MYNTIGLFVVYIDTGSPVPNIASKSRGLADENNKLFDEMETTRNNRIGTLLCQGTGTWLSIFFKSAVLHYLQVVLFIQI